MRQSTRARTTSLRTEKGTGKEGGGRGGGIRVAEHLHPIFFPFFFRTMALPRVVSAEVAKGKEGGLSAFLFC